MRSGLHGEGFSDGCKRKRSIKDDFQVLGLRNEKDRVAIDGDREVREVSSSVENVQGIPSGLQTDLSGSWM